MTTAARAMRATRQRAAVSSLLDRSADFRSAQEIHEELRRVGEGIGLTTVYRTLQALADAGEVDVLQHDGAEERLPDPPHLEPRRGALVRHHATSSGRSVRCAICRPISTLSSVPPHTGSSCSTDRTPSKPPW